MPNVNQVYVNNILTNVGVQYMQADTEFIADKVFPSVPVQLSAGTYYEFNRDMFGRADAKPRADATETEGGSWNQTTNPYNCLPVMGYHTDLGEQLRANYPNSLDLEKQATMFISRIILQSKERKFVNSFFKPGIWGTDDNLALNSGVEQWDKDTSNPVKRVKAAIRAVHLASLVKPNTMVLSGEAYDALTEHPDILDRLKYGGTNATPADVSKEALAQIFGLDRVLVGEAVEITSPAGETIVSGYSYGKHAWIGYAAKNAALFLPSAGYTFEWTGYLESKPGGMDKKAMGVFSWYIREIKAQRVEGEYACDMRVVASAMGYFFQNVVS